MRKRAQRRSITIFDESKPVVQQAEPIVEKKPFRLKKNWWIALCLIFIFLLVLFFNTYYNLTSGVAINSEGQGFEKFYLSGPDPYYNLRLVEGTYNTGKYPYYYTADPILNYPIGSLGGRAPLFNMMALGFSRFLTPFMSEIDAIGYSMQFIPALFGALLVFVVYFIGKELFNKKAGLIGAMFIAIIPIHLSSGHGSAYSLFDHDSFNLLLFFLTFLFLIKSLKEENKTKSLLYAILGGVPLAALSLVWVEAQYLYAVIGIYAIVQMLIDIFTNKIEAKVFRTTTVILFVGYLISMPVVAFDVNGFTTNISFYICVVVAIFGLVYYIFGVKKIPWTLSIPAIFSITAVGLAFLYFGENLIRSLGLSPLLRVRDLIFGVGIYGDKVSMTIAEANTYQISNTVMSFGPALYWVGWIGFVLLCYFYYKNKQRREYLFILVLFLINIWLAGVAGRFINDMVPVIAVLSGWIIWLLVDKIDFKQMLRNIRGAGGGFHGIRKGIKFLHIFGIFFIAFILILPNAFVTFDAAIPYKAYQKADGNWTTIKQEMFGSDFRGAYGLGIVKEKYWIPALDWLKDQDNYTSDPTKRPAFISWWDYGFYESAIGAHPTVADNFQDGIPPAANFHTASSEQEAVAVLIIRLLEGNLNNNNMKLTQNIVQILTNHLGVNNSKKIEEWFNAGFTNSPSFGDPIGAIYDNKTSKKYTVGQQYAINAVYHDVAEMITGNLTDDQITWLYHDLQQATGWSIRYYGVEGYDKQIFNIFAFLSDKSLLLVNGIADDYIELQYKGYTVNSQGQKLADKTWTATEIINMPREERRFVVVTGTNQIYKDLYFDTMFYRTYIGPSQGASGSKKEYDYQIPCIDMKHYYAEYIGDFSNPELQYYDTGKAAVVIAKYYEGVYINGTVNFNGNPIDAEIDMAVQKNLTYRPGLEIPIDHDTVRVNLTNNIFNLTAGAGALIQIRRNLGNASFTMKNVTFDGEEGSSLAPLTDNDAMRKVGSNFERTLNISIEPADFEGYFYNDTDDDGVFNATVDEPLSNETVTLYEITEFSQDSVALDEANRVVMKTNESGHFNVSGLLPGIYRLLIQDQNGFTHHFNDIPLYEGNNIYNASNAKPAKLEGLVYYDSNKDENYTSGEEIADVDVELSFYGEIINTTKTDAAGRFSFGSIIPGVINSQNLNPYTIKASKLPDYISETTVYPAENETTTVNISIGLNPVTVNGYTRYNSAAVSGITINFEPDGSSIAGSGNTAVAGQAISATNGSYSASLIPGYYNVSITKSSGSTIVYTFSGKLSLTIGQVSATYDISMNKNSSTVSGITSYQGNSIDNISISLAPDGSVVNNTAIATSTLSSVSGLFTVEVAPGRYNVTVNTTRNESGKNYSYKFVGTLDISATPSPETYNIVLTKEAVP